MKKRDVVTLIFACVIIGVAIFFMMRMLFPPADNSEVTEEAEKIPTVPATIDETTYKNVEGLSDYGAVNLEGIGKSNLFAGF
jgi:hypothetical protein